MPVMTDTKLKQLRKQFDPPVTQEDFAVSAGLRIKTYRRAEGGENTSYTTAQAILKNINALRAERQMSPVTLDDLGLHIV